PPINPFLARFHVNLRAGAAGDVLLHFNPRFGEGAVVRNSQLGGSWGHEERDLPPGPSPFQRGQYFDVS
ncbi:LEG5 protein, partial [Urocolius indicus]|nr:LEG5 protein [Urocolius indicus]